MTPWPATTDSTRHKIAALQNMQPDAEMATYDHYEAETLGQYRSLF